MAGLAARRRYVMKWSKTTGLGCQSRRSTNKRTSTQWREGSVCDPREECKACAAVRRGWLVELRSADH